MSKHARTLYPISLNKATVFNRHICLFELITSNHAFGCFSHKQECGTVIPVTTSVPTTSAFMLNVVSRLREEVTNVQFISLQNQFVK